MLPTRAMGADDADCAVALRGPAEHARAVDVRLAVRRRSNATRGSTRCRRSTRCSRRSPCSTTSSCRGSGSSAVRRARARRADRARRSSSTTASPRSPTSSRCSTRSWARRRAIAEMNGVQRAGHIRDKLTQLVIYAETVRALARARGAAGATSATHGICLPRLRDHQHRQVHVRDRLPRGDASSCRTARAVCSSPGRAATTGTAPRSAPVLEKYYRRRGARGRDGSR